jgi:hypothetical protein
MRSFYLKYEFRIALLATTIIFLALVRTLAEPFRLQYYSAGGLNYGSLKPLLTGALVAATALFIMAILSFYKKYSGINIISLLAIFLLLLLKCIFAIG